MVSGRKEDRSISASGRISKALAASLAFHLAAVGLAFRGPAARERVLIALSPLQVALSTGDSPAAPKRPRPPSKAPRAPLPDSADSAAPAAAAPPPAPGGAPQARSQDAVLEGASRPAYPRVSRALGEEGEALVRVRIEADGGVSSAEIERSSGHERLDRAATEFLRSARFKRESAAQGSLTKSVAIRFQLNSTD